MNESLCGTEPLLHLSLVKVPTHPDRLYPAPQLVVLNF